MVSLFSPTRSSAVAVLFSLDACWVTEHGLCFVGHWFLHWGDQGFKLVHKWVSRGLWIKGYEALQGFGWDALAFSLLESFSHFLQPLPSSFQPAAFQGKAARAVFKQLLQGKVLMRTLTLLLWLLLARASSECQRYRKPEEHGPRLFQWLRYKKLIAKGELALCSVWKGFHPFPLVFLLLLILLFPVPWGKPHSVQRGEGQGFDVRQMWIWKPGPPPLAVWPWTIIPITSHFF